MTKKEYEIQLLSLDILNTEIKLLTFHCPQIAQEAESGQFVNLSVPGNFLLKRPFGISSTNPEDGTFSIGVRSAGQGTRELLNSKPGDFFSALGPLGNGFSLEGVRKIIAIGGGTGIFPLRFALEAAKKKEIPNICVIGFRSRKDAVFLKELEALSENNFIVTTDSGDLGTKGTVLDGLKQLHPEDLQDSTILCVGPEIMMKHVTDWAKKNNLPCQISMEKRMACGIGICLVCACKVTHEENDFHHVRCCREGPVFPADQIIWEN